LVAACRTATPARPPLEPETRVTLPPRDRPGALTPAERDSLVRELAVHRAAWRERQIADYQIQVAAGCFCPWPSNPAILEVRGGVPVALRDTSGNAMGKPREPWSIYTVEGLFDAVAQSARSSDVVQVAYDPQYGYPAMIRGIGRVGLPDNWFWVKASRLTPAR
jgi:hypothetical protein